MKKLIIAGLAIAGLSAAAHSETLVFTGTAPATCTFSSTAAGTLSNNTTTLFSTAQASTVVSNNSAATYTLDVAPTNSLSVAPAGATLSGNVVRDITLTGANSTSATSTSTAEGFVLANAGVDTVTVDIVSATVTPNVLAGGYTINVEVTCNAI